jgi:alkylation response protein AidB-like acyl-CoA dehydrogenase
MYKPPLTDLLFNLTRLIGLDRPVYAGLAADLVSPILEEAGKLAAESFAPLNRVGDNTGVKLVNGRVVMPPGFRDAYQHYVEGGWNGLCFPEDLGGQNLPFLLAMPIQEMLQGANLSLALCTLLNQGAIELLHTHGTAEQKTAYLPKLVSGEWTGTMNLTEPQAGSDVGAVATRAWKDGTHYKVQGQKIFISFGGHDLTDNILHLVLARLPGAPAGTKGLSLFLVPQNMADGKANDVRVASLEHKLGQHASPTCVMAFGDAGGAYAELVGKENGGIEAMFVMMNNARIGVGIQGLGLCENALQLAAEYARTRVQSRPLKKGADKPVAIIHHPDVRRMLLGMKAQTEAARSLALRAALAMDEAKTGNAAAQARLDLLTPIIKAWLTELANEITSTAVQVFGGMGYVEETGVAQGMRDARVLAIYEGTNGIQANDLLFRKVLRDDGAALNAYVNEMQEVANRLEAAPGDDAHSMAAALHSSLTHLVEAATHLMATGKSDSDIAALAATPFLHLCALTACGAESARAMLAAAEDLKNPGEFSADFLEAKLITGRFYAESILPRTGALLVTIKYSQRGILSMPETWF